MFAACFIRVYRVVHFSLTPFVKNSLQTTNCVGHSYRLDGRSLFSRKRNVQWFAFGTLCRRYSYKSQQRIYFHPGWRMMLNKRPFWYPHNTDRRIPEIRPPGHRFSRHWQTAFQSRSGPIQLFLIFFFFLLLILFRIMCFYFFFILPSY